MFRFLYGFGMLAIYFVVFAGAVIATRRVFSVKSEVFRKLLHLGVLCSIFVFLYAFDVWWHAAIASLTLAVLIFPILHFGERIKGYSALFVQREPNEVKWSMIQIFVTYAVVVAVSKGVFGSNYLAVASVFAWGFGDAAAALVGKKFGKHKLRAFLIEGEKSVEGSTAMAVTAFVACGIVLIAAGAAVWYISVVVAALTGIASSVVELYTRKGADTVTCPIAALAILSGLLWLAGGIGPIWL